MAHALPIAKLATLLVKTLAKPISRRIKHEFSRSEPTKRMLIGTGQMAHSVTSRMTIWSQGYAVRRITPLEEEKALGDGAEIIGETFILMVSMSAVIWEYNRSSKKAQEKDDQLRAMAQAERDALRANFKALDERLRAVEEVVQHNSQSILNITGKRYVEPKKKQLVGIYKEDEEDDAGEQNQPAKPPNSDDGDLMDVTPSRPWWKFW